VFISFSYLYPCQIIFIKTYPGKDFFPAANGYVFVFAKKYGLAIIFLLPGFFCMQPQKIATEIATLRQIEDIYRMQAREYIQKLKQTIARRKQLERLITPKEN
jgi:hypothetical protein